MNPRTILTIAFALLTVSFSARAENLAEILEQAELGALIGTWVDEDSNGEAISITYAWRVPSHALGMSVKTADRNTEALIAVDPKSGEVVHHSVDSKGGMGRGKWAEEDGVATLTLQLVNDEQEEMTLKITHAIIDNKKLVIGLKNADTDEGGEVTLVRKAE